MRPVPVEDIVYARAVEIVTERVRRIDLLTSRDVAAAVRSTKAEVQRELRQRQFDQLVKTVVVHVHRNSARYRLDAEMENQVRARRGKPRAPIETLIVQLAMQEVVERVPTSSLTTADARGAIRAAKQRIEATFQTLPAGVDDRIRRRPVG